MSKKILLAVSFLLVITQVHAQWAPDARLTNSTDSSLTSYTMQRGIAARGDTVHLTWSDKSFPSTGDGGNDRFGIYFMRSFNGGLSWETARRLTASPGTSFSSSISVSGSLIHLVWRDDRDGNQEIYYIRSTDGGETWGQETRLTVNPARSYMPGVAACGQTVHVVWVDTRPPGYYGICYKRSDDGGLTWGADTRLTESTSFALNPSLAVSGENVYLAWDDNQDGNKEIYFKRSADGGQTWQPDSRLTFENGASQCPSIDVSGPYIHVVWDNAVSGSYEIFYLRSPDGGLAWDSIKQLTVDPGYSLWANVSAYGPTVHVAWEDDRTGNIGIYYKSSSDNGQTWGGEVQLNDVSFYSGKPNIAVSGPAVHAAWYDYRDFNCEIYYKRNPTGGVTGLPESNMVSPVSGIRVFPNPTSNLLNVGFDRPEPTAEPMTISVRNLPGTEVLRREFIPGTGTIDVSQLECGMYFLMIMSPNQPSFSQKFVISR